MLLNRLTKTKRRDATLITEDDMKKMRKMYYEDGIKTDALCRIFRIGKARLICLLNNDKSALGGYCKRKKNIRGGDIESNEGEESSNDTETSKLDMNDIQDVCKRRMEIIEDNKNKRLEWLAENTTT